MAPQAPVLLFLHGLDMSPEGVMPVLQALRLPGPVCMPEAPFEDAQGRAWWPVDRQARAQRMARGPADLHDANPQGREAARAAVQQCVVQIREHWPDRPLVMAGFSQGGMLALDALLQHDSTLTPPDGLVVLSATRLALADWAPYLSRVNGLRMLVAHGRTDGDLCFSAGERLVDLMRGHGASVDWLPFDGGHEIPLVVWRRLRKFVTEFS